MKVINLEKRKLEFKDYVRRSAEEKDFDTLLEEPCIATYNNQILFIYDILDEDTSLIQNVLQGIEYTQTTRTSGLKTTSKIFGFAPRNVL